LLVGIPIQGRLEVQAICVIGIAGQLALEDGSIALSCPALVEAVQDRVE